MKIVWLGLLIAIATACEHGRGGGMFGNTDGGLPPGSNQPCGTGGDFGCPPSEFCDFGANRCGADDVGGFCHTRPQGCPDLFDPVCGCDGIVHGNECDANAAGVDVNAFGGCPVEPGSFTCGFRQCSLDLALCAVFGSDVGGEPDGFACQNLPDCGGVPTCDCLIAAGVPCADISCTGDARTGLTVTCPGG